MSIPEYDRLTGVYTREAFCEHAQQKVQSNRDTKYDIVISDFVNFKHFNARYGTAAGDLLLIRTGKMLSMAGPEVICGRYGADRFVSIVRHLDGMGLALLQNFRLPEEAKEVLPVESIVVKFGVCTVEDPDIPISVYCDMAYVAIQSVKHRYGENVAVYDHEEGRKLHNEVIMEEHMQEALERRQFKVYYQPKMRLSSGQICGAEALVRWEHPELGFLLPKDFIPLFERNGFITELDLYVWDCVCKDIENWKARGIPVVPVSANVSGKDFALADLSDRILDIADLHGIAHELLHLEITESCCANDRESVVRHVNALHDAGFGIELDDFGAGFTSLVSLNEVKADVLKLDMSLLRKDTPDTERSVLTFALQLARMMNLTAIQEGVETKEQAERLKVLGCDVIQGYYCSKPVPCDMFTALLEGK